MFLSSSGRGRGPEYHLTTQLESTTEPVRAQEIKIGWLALRREVARFVSYSTTSSSMYICLSNGVSRWILKH